MTASAIPPEFERQGRCPKNLIAVGVSEKWCFTRQSKELFYAFHLTWCFEHVERKTLSDGWIQRLPQRAGHFVRFLAMIRCLLEMEPGILKRVCRQPVSHRSFEELREETTL